MVTSVNMAEQFSVAIKSLNEQKDKLDKATQSIAEQEKASQKAEVLMHPNNDEIEDKYIPSYDFNKTGADYYDKNWSSQNFSDIQRHSNSLEEFTINLKKTIVEDYKRQNPSTNVDVCDINGNLSGSSCPIMEKYLNTIDYTKEYEEYKQSRGCATDEELKALNSVSFVKTKYDLLDIANSHMFRITDTLQNNGFLTQEPFDDKVNPSSVINQLNLQDVADYLNAQQSTHNFKGEASAFQSFADLISKQDNIDEKTRSVFALLSKDITNSKSGIALVSNEIERINAKELSAKSQYNASLIAKYDS